jgi:hypothetical protein
MSSVIRRIRETLDGLCKDAETPMEGVWYGACKAKGLQNWNYFVFNRRKTTKAGSTNRVDLQTLYEVHIIHEDAIPDGYVLKVIDALQEQAEPGTKLKVTSDDIEYDYTFKGSTNMVVEIATITFLHPEKRC